MGNQQRAFTLTELMIVVAIIGILAVIAYPSYTQYKIRTNRTEIQSEMMQQAQYLQGYYVINHNYSGATLNNGSTEKDYPDSNAVYKINFEPNGQTYTLTATPSSGTIQAGDGAVSLDATNQQCWYKGSDDATGTCLAWTAR